MAKKIALDCAEKDDFSKRMEFRKKSNIELNNLNFGFILLRTS